jgi:hypothetical protein
MLPYVFDEPNLILLLSGKSQHIYAIFMDYQRNHWLFKE